MFDFDFYSGWELLVFVLIVLALIIVWFIAVVALSTLLTWAVGFFFGDELVDLKLLRTIMIAIGFAAPLFILKGGE